MSIILETDSGSALNITTEQAIGEYTATDDILVQASGRLSSLNGAAATMTVVLRHKSPVDTTLGEFYFAQPKRATADTVFRFEFQPVLLKNTEKLEVRILSSNANDTSITWAITWVNAQAVDVEKISSDSTAADNLELDYDGTGYAKANSTIGTTTTNTDIGAAGASLTDLGGMSTGMKAEVNAEVVDVLKTDTVTLPGQGAPTATPTMEAILGWLYKTFRNKKTQTATQWNLYDDAGTTIDSKATVADDGTTASKAEIGSGP